MARKHLSRLALTGPSTLALALACTVQGCGVVMQFMIIEEHVIMFQKIIVLRIVPVIGDVKKKKIYVVYVMGMILPVKIAKGLQMVMQF